MSQVNYGSVATDRYLSAADMALGTEKNTPCASSSCRRPTRPDPPRDCVKNQHGMHARTHMSGSVYQSAGAQVLKGRVHAP